MAAGEIARTKARWANVLTLVAVVVAVTLALRLVGARAGGIDRAWLQVVGYGLIAGTAVGLALVRERAGWASLGFERRHGGWQLVWAGLLLGVLLLAFVGLPLALGLTPSELFGLPPSSRGELIAVIAFDLVCVGFGEELVFRGYLLTRLADLLRSSIAAALVSSAAFGLWHMLAGGGWLQCLLTAGIGLILALARQLLPHATTVSVALAHGCYDVALVLGAIWLV